MSYDPTYYSGSARHYLAGRPAYSRQLSAVLSAECGLDGSGRLLDVGCGPGVLAVELAPFVAEVIGLDPDEEMLAAASEHAAAGGVRSARWVRATAEEIPDLALGAFRLVTFGQSFHWTEREVVTEACYALLEPGGSMALITHTVEGRTKPAGPGYPEIPHDEIKDLIRSYLGPQLRAGQGLARAPADRFEDALARSRFGPPRVVFARGREDIVRDVEGVLAGFLSMSFAAPHLFGDRLDRFQNEVREFLRRASPDGWFWDWPGDTSIILARKPSALG